MENYPNSYYFNSINRPLAKHETLKGDYNCDVCVIGGGFSGLSTALEAARLGLSVILIEQNKIAWGASGRNGGQIWPDTSWGIERIESQYGYNLARKIWDISLNGVSLIDERIKEFDINCDKKLGGILAATSSRKLKEFEEEKEYFSKKYDFNETEILNKNDVENEIGSKRYYGGFLIKNAGHIHPLKYALGLADAASSLNVKIFESSPATKINKGKYSIEVISNNGKITTKNLAVCCNAYIKGLNLGIESKIMPVDTYIVGTKPLSSNLLGTILPKDYCVSDTNFDLNYYRLSKEKNMLFGGGVSYSLKNVEGLKSRTKKQLVKVFPQLLDTSIEFLWGGLIAISLNRVPNIGQLSDNIFYAQGFSGHGVAFSGIAGKIIANSIHSGKTSELESFERIKHKNFPGGRLLRIPFLVTISAMQRMMDVFNA